MYLVSWLTNWWSQPEDLPPEWLLALNLPNQPEEESCPYRTLIQSKTTGLNEPSLSPEIRSNIFQQLVTEELPSWKTGLETIIKKRYLGKVFELSSQQSGTASSRLAALRPQLRDIYQRQKSDLDKLVDLSATQLASMSSLVSQDSLTPATATDLAMTWFRCLQATVKTILESDLTKVESSALATSLLPSIDKLQLLWQERVRIRPVSLTVRVKEENTEKGYGEVEQLPHLNSEEFHRRMDLLQQLLGNR